MCTAGFSDHAKKLIAEKQSQVELPAQNGLKVMPAGEGRASFFSLVKSLCYSGPLRCILQEVSDEALGPYSTVSLVFTTMAEPIIGKDEDIFTTPQTITEDLPFPVGLQLLKVTAAGAGVELKPETNPSRKPHSKSGIF